MILVLPVIQHRYKNVLNGSSTTSYTTQVARRMYRMVAVHIKHRYKNFLKGSSSTIYTTQVGECTEFLKDTSIVRLFLRL